MKTTRNVYYFDYSNETYRYIMASRILRQSEKNLLKNIVEEKKTVKEIATDEDVSDRTICRRRKKLFEKTKCLMNYTKQDGDIEEYYKNHYKKQENDILKIYGDNEFKVVINDTRLYKVYLLTFPNNKVYVGITSVDEKDRWKKGDGYIDNEFMYNDILKYGWVNIRKNILYKDLLFEEAIEKEKEMIIHYKSHLKKYGYNRSF